MKYLIIILILTSFISCNITKDNKTDKTNKSDKPGNKMNVNFDKSMEVILPAEPGMDWLFGKNYKNWTPSDDDIETASQLFVYGFEDQKRGTVNRVLYRTPEEYYKQFVGAIDSAGDKIIWINCFCKKEADTFKDWKDRIIRVSDGGNCFINVKTNISKNKYTEFNVNGGP